MMRIYHIFLTVLSLGLALMAASCETGNFDDLSPKPYDGWITLQFVVPGETSITRANPAGGEDGNGREDGIEKENEIQDLNIFILNPQDGFLNADSDNKLSHFYFNLQNPTSSQNTVEFTFEKSTENNNTLYILHFYVSSFPGLTESEFTKRFITVANIGEKIKSGLDETLKEGEVAVATLEDLRNYILKKTWTGSGDNVKDYTNFVMTTAYDYALSDDCNSTLTVEEPTKKISGKTALQRMCARIDVMYGDNTLKDSELQYEVGNSGKVHITNMLPVNVMSKPSYLFKRVTENVPAAWGSENDLGALKWGGKETTTTSGIPSNYVIEPFTLSKGVNDDLEEWYGSTRTDNVKSRIMDSSTGKVADYYSGSLPTTDLGCTKMTILGYANENTQSPLNYTSKYMTGIAMRAIYQPEKVYKDATCTTEATIEDAISSIWRYSPSVEAAGTEISVDESRSLYFTNEAAAIAYKNNHPVENGIITEFTEGGIFGEGEGRYIGFYSYYNLWLRHYDDVNDADKSDPHKTFPMQYAIVRNNIYRVSFTFSGPGDPVPTMREPETLKARIFVRKWNYRVEEEIDF